MTKIKEFIGRYHIFRILFPFLILTNRFLNSNGDTEFCVASGSDPIYWINKTNCPGGILFPEPVEVDCLATTDTGTIETDVCQDGTAAVLEEFPLKIQFLPVSDGAAISEADTCNSEYKCGHKGFMESNWVNKVQVPMLPRKDEPWPDAKSGTDNVFAQNQTQRLFKYLLGSDIEEGPSLRIITLLRKSFEILGKFCDSRFVPLAFGEDVLNAFLFLLSESDTTNIIDVPIDDFRRIDKALNDCLDKKNPFRFKGNGCKTRSFIDSITIKGHVVVYEPDEFSWKADKHDIPVDVTWATADFVHGLCYGTFKKHVNSHHLFQQAIERIFTPEIIFRWDKPVTLARQDAWDNFFSANVRNAIGNLEYCIHAAYYDAPFLHRLERMLLKYTGTGRKKRNTAVYPLSEYKNLKFFCLADDEDRKNVLEKYKKAVCE